MLFVAGKEDAVGNFGKGVESVYRRYKQNGIADVMIRLYENDRHEILNELDRDKVFQDILKWLDYKI
jgi:alpha-beta hydrolase superfamily lysophospholipase